MNEERKNLDARGLLPNPNPEGKQLITAKKAVLKHYGMVIGELQAENICYSVLVAARMAALSEDTE